MSAPSFRWQALLQRAGDAVFVLDRRRRLLFVNAAWEQLAGVNLDRVRGLICRAPRPVGPDEPLESQLAHILTPPVEAVQGQVTRTRRLFTPPPPRDSGFLEPPRWWDVEFLPFRHAGPKDGYFLLGRIIAVPEETATGTDPFTVLPERLEGLRLRHCSQFTFALLESVKPAMRQLAEQARLASTVRAPVLLRGEAGTGKATVARIIHYQSSDKEHALAALDCRRLPAAVIADVLLGERQSATWQGLGAIYLAEPACLPRDLQLRLCEWLASRRDGAGSPRLFFACRGKPLDDVRAGRLLEELYWRMATLTLRVPPLRERIEDIPHLVTRLLGQCNKEGDKMIKGLTPTAHDAFRAYRWPGNLRELRQVLLRAAGRANSDHVDVMDLPLPLRLTTHLNTPGPPAPLPLEDTLAQVERRLIRLALHRARGNRTRAAELLGIHRPRLLRRMEALGLESAEGESE